MTHYLLMAMAKGPEHCPWALHYAPVFAQINHLLIAFPSPVIDEVE